MKSFWFILIVSFLTFSCVTQKPKSTKNKILDDKLNSLKLLENSFVGIKVLDPSTQEVLYSLNEKKYFTPASNTKILTLYSGLKTLGDSIPGLKYTFKNDTLFIAGTADPTFLHPDFEPSKTLDFLRKYNNKTIVFSDSNFQNETLGSGWSWDDYNDDYQVELSSFPISGNIVRFKNAKGETTLNPKYFKDSIFNKDSQLDFIKRNINENVFYTNSGILNNKKFSQDIPFKTSTSLIKALLEDTLKRNIALKHFKIDSSFKTIYSLPVDTVYRRMMKISDNMLAEHLLLLAGGKFSDTISSSKSIQNIQKAYFSEMPQPFNWVDGSGLSRYNLFTPESLVFLLEKMLKDFSQERIFPLMAIGGQAGTLNSIYKSPRPFVFAKSGSMSGVYNQSGYLISKKGKLLIFSIMNNNFTGSISKYRNLTSEIIQVFYENY
ncbi:hypothetical protein EGI22_01630 [Lacihabitans sp. LS3-19]|uniref:D-alanyl-D-alanine carboxypeptidase/D-alanyl-D-alanine-endopeptidase n=1 Tax=Lacihabitans sp. LS3-19 TaxID=2487335 RepID=UPI0020CE1CB9|nr:D-alanyl-D-alanine carboxypeptidase [Lacihabitans sp. LS3-19]MCP9766589.1 hypothetical protein [Lacihabitans sp. LS3-19]